jgi:transcriptional antiterminator RfaH
MGPPPVLWAAVGLVVASVRQVGLRKAPSKFWIVLKTKQASSRDAVLQTLRQGFEIFHPKLRLQSLRGVRKPAPLFPHYLIVRVDERKQNWKVLCSTRGVSYVLMDGDRPSRIRDEVVAKLRHLTDDTPDGYFFDHTQEAPRFKPDCTVLGLRGLFEDKFGTYRGLAGNRAERVRVLFSILGKEAEFEVNACDLVAAA